MTTTRTKKSAKEVLPRIKVVEDLHLLQRQRTVVLKSRIMQANRLQAVVAGQLGYEAKMPESERRKKFVEAGEMIQEIRNGGGNGFVFQGIVQTTLIGIQAFEDLQDQFESEMVKLAKMLPVHKWVEAKEQSGFGTKSLAIVIGETGDLFNYANVAKVWRRMSLAPWTFNGKTLMGATWRSGKEGKLPSTEWELYGYSPRRRSLMYVIGEGLVKQNCKKNEDKEGYSWLGPYRAEYDKAKADAIANRPEWTACSCKGTGLTAKKTKCSECMGKGKKLKRAHLHGMLVATKLLLANLWAEWRK